MVLGQASWFSANRFSDLANHLSDFTNRFSKFANRLFGFRYSEVTAMLWGHSQVIFRQRMVNASQELIVDV